MTGDEIRAYQRGEIRRFVAIHNYAERRVLDYGCGAAPYRDVIEDFGGEWHGYNRAWYPGGPQVNVGDDDPLGRRWDVVLSTQMLQYVPHPDELLANFAQALYPHGWLVLTYATNWPEVEREDLHRFTRTGMEALLGGWTIEQHEPLGSLPFDDREELVFGYGVRARP